MSEPGLRALVDAARAYEGLFVDALFGQWPPMVAESARIGPGQRVLDVACGTGVLARDAAARTGPTGYVAGVDPGPGMLAIARELAPNVDWRQGVAESLPFADGSFDAVGCQFGLMFFSERRRALGEMLRVLRPHGHLVVVTWDAVENIPAYADEVALLERVAGSRAAAALRAPFVLGDRDKLAGLVLAAGGAAVSVTTHRGTARFPSVRVMVEADLRGWLPVMGVALDEPAIDRVLRDAESVLGEYVKPDGRVEFQVQAHFVTATKS